MFEKTCKKYGLDPKKLEYFKKRGILGERAGDGDLERAAAIEEIVRYFRPETNREEKARILRGLRAELLEKLHCTQKCIDKIDCLLYALLEK